MPPKKKPRQCATTVALRKLLTIRQGDAPLVKAAKMMLAKLDDPKLEHLVANLECVDVLSLCSGSELQGLTGKSTTTHWPDPARPDPTRPKCEIVANLKVVGFKLSNCSKIWGVGASKCEVVANNWGLGVLQSVKLSQKLGGASKCETVARSGGWVLRSVKLSQILFSS